MDTDVLVIGCGIAGATAALRLARNPARRVTVLTAADDPLESNTGHAQGGIVLVDDGDLSLIDDIVRASAHTASPKAAAELVRNGGRLFREVLLSAAPVAFDADASGRLRLGLEGGHSLRRIAHVADGTGHAIASALVAAVSRQPNITLRTRTIALDLIMTPDEAGEPRCVGVLALDSTGDVETISAAATIIATGGLAATYLHTTNPAGARGDGIAMAARAGAQVSGLEYVQFHPTALAAAGAENFLISEAVRGEGAVLVGPTGHAFMRSYSPEWGDLAPRDVVARAIDEQMRVHGTSHVYLDMTAGMTADRILTRFPGIARRCAEHGIDITREAIPIRPAAHYTCGGIVVDAAGRTSLDGLYAVGEASNTGLHGANRLASTSLLEGLVWGASAADDIESRLACGVVGTAAGLRHEAVRQAAIDAADACNEAPDLDFVDRMTSRLHEVMWLDVGLIRSTEGLERATLRLEEMQREIRVRARRWRPSTRTAGLRNAVDAGLLVARAAYRRQESRGCHYRADMAPLRAAV